MGVAGAHWANMLHHDRGERAIEYRELGRSGLRVSKLCLGTMVGFREADQGNATRVVREAIDLGVNSIDTGDCYGESEETVGSYFEGNVYRALRMGYAAAARKLPGTGACIPVDDESGGKKR